MKASPFIYGSTVSTHAFTNREKEITKLRNNLSQGIHTMIISPRRWGKSSLVEKVIQDIDREDDGDVRSVIIDLFSVSSAEEFLELFAREVIKASSTKVEEWLAAGRDFFKQLMPKLKIGIDPQTDFSIGFDWKELQQHSAEIFDLPETIAAKKNIRFIICLDEFQKLATFKDYEPFEKKMRSVWQRQKRVTYCLYGSKRHMMSDIFNNPSKPFYRFGDILFLQKIALDKWVPFIVQGFADSGKRISEEHAAWIPQVMKNHPWYVQQLAHYAWNATDRTAGMSELTRALDELIFANMPFYQNEAEQLSPTRLNLLKAVASGETQLTSARVIEQYRLGTPRNVLKNKKLLIENDLIDE